MMDKQPIKNGFTKQTWNVYVYLYAYLILINTGIVTVKDKK